MARKVKSGAAAAPLFAAREKLPRRDAMRLLALMAGTLCAMMVIIGVSIKVLGANWIACMAPLLFPRVTIMAMQLLTKMKAKGSEY